MPNENTPRETKGGFGESHCGNLEQLKTKKIKGKKGEVPTPTRDPHAKAKASDTKPEDK